MVLSSEKNPTKKNASFVNVSNSSFSFLHSHFRKVEKHTTQKLKELNMKRKYWEWKLVFWIYNNEICCFQKPLIHCLQFLKTFSKHQMRLKRQFPSSKTLENRTMFWRIDNKRPPYSLEIVLLRITGITKWSRLRRNHDIIYRRSVGTVRSLLWIS